MQISEITGNDIIELKYLQPDDWPDIRPFYIFYINNNFCQPLKLVLGKETVGIGAIILHQTTAWLAHIIVHKDYRNRGIGGKVTQALVEQVNKKKIKTISLIATDIGEPVYKKLGFQKEMEYLFFKQEQGIKFDTDINIIQSQSSLYSDILALDKLVSGEDRISLLENHLENSWVYYDKGIIMGFYLPTLNEGLVVAKDKVAGRELLKYRLNTKHICILPEKNKYAIAMLLENNFKNLQKGIRMSLGPSVNFQGEMLYNRIGGNLG